MYIGQDLPPTAKDTASAAKIAYILYLAGPFTGGLGWMAAVVIAYACRDGAPDWLATHYRFQIRTFWIGLLPLLICLPLCLVVIGFLPLGLLVLWIMIRAARGLRLVVNGQAVPNATSWGIG